MLIKFRYLFFVLLAGTIYYCFSQKNNSLTIPSEYVLANQLYVQAEKLNAAVDLNEVIELQQEKLNRNALELFKKIIADPGQTVNDSILFHCYVKAGLLEHYFDSLPQARSFYLKALTFQSRLPAIADSFFFKPALFAGSIFYSQNLFDSAFSYYKKAEAIADGYTKPLEEMERLYNRMGVMYYETGNYRLANNYFQKAFSQLSVKNPAYEDLLINYKMNIASISVKLEDYQKADSIFKSILRYNIHRNEINHNIGIINLRSGNYKEALSYFQKVKYDNNPKIIEFDYNMAEAFSNLGQKDSSSFYINKAIRENGLMNANRKNVSMGLILKFIADEKLKENNIDSALKYYQQALCQFYPSFNETDIYSVPEKYSAVFSYINLFNTLVAKGDAFKIAFTNKKDKAALEAAFNAYRSAFALADYVAKTYDSDEARFFLNRIKYTAHNKAIQASLDLYEMTGKKYYLEEAYLFDQRNKASALTLSLQENSMQKEAASPGDLSAQLANIRSAITRLSLKAGRVTDSIALKELNNEIRDNEIKLSRVQEQINNDPKYARLEPAIQIPSSEKLQQLLDNETSLLSYHLSQDQLLIFTLNKNDFSYVKQTIDTAFFQNVSSFIKSLQNVDGSQKYDGAAAATRLYDILIKPVYSKIDKSTRLIIIPDDELNYIAFEALQNEQKNYLVKSFAIQYQFSTALLRLAEIKNDQQKNVLAFAPFTNNIPGSRFHPLPYSKNEVADLQGKIFIDSEATKKHFIENANKYGIMQFATHAVANDAEPKRSFIAFYPQKNDSSDESTLYAQEIYNLRLDSTNLVILSACETGSGQLIRGEGLMSISRAFSYAGCPNMITTLWKASDRTTAFLIKRLHLYINKGYSKDRCLQMAKADLLNSNEISPALKTPNYWAQLVFIGNYEPAQKSYKWYWIAAIFVVLSGIYLLIKKMSRKNAGPSAGFS